MSNNFRDLILARLNRAKHNHTEEMHPFHVIKYAFPQAEIATIHLNVAWSIIAYYLGETYATA